MLKNSSPNSWLLPTLYVYHFLTALYVVQGRLARLTCFCVFVRVSFHFWPKHFVFVCEFVSIFPCRSFFMLGTHIVGPTTGCLSSLCVWCSFCMFVLSSMVIIFLPSLARRRYLVLGRPGYRAAGLYFTMRHLLRTKEGSAILYAL